jgi:hypothetical protein
MLKTIAAGPGGCLAPGEHEVPAELGRALVAGGYAVAVEVRKPEAPAEPVPMVETAEAPIRGERAEAMARKGRRGR